MTRIKEDIIRDVMTKITLDRKCAKNLVEAILGIIKNALESGEEVMISGFGYFKVRHKRSRIGRNPKTKVSYEISERTVVTFYPSKVFRKELNPDFVK
ncbi:integration host factor subunit alpha [bacterium]|nr:integration host factor subunit alpha [bacterium]